LTRSFFSSSLSFFPFRLHSIPKLKLSCPKVSAFPSKLTSASVVETALRLHIIAIY
jgi:hypothetical protein